MYEKKYVDYLGHKGTILPRYNGDWVYFDGPDIPSNYPQIRFIASVNTKPDPEDLWDKVADYCENDVRATEEFLKTLALFNIRNNDISKLKMTYGCPGIKKVIFNEPATIVIWDDGTKTVVKCSEGDTYSEWSGLAFCICKKLMGDEFHKVFKHWCDRDDIRKPIYDVRHTDPGETSESMFSIKNVIEASSKISETFEEALKLK